MQYLEEITAESLLNFAPVKPLYAAIFLVLLYAFKSLTVFFPIIVLNVLGGFLFKPYHALIVNTVGVLVELAMWILAAVTVGGGIAGPVGMLLSVPIASTIYVLVCEVTDKREMKMKEG